MSAFDVTCPVHHAFEGTYAQAQKEITLYLQLPLVVPCVTISNICASNDAASNGL